MFFQGQQCIEEVKHCKFKCDGLHISQLKIEKSYYTVVQRLLRWLPSAVDDCENDVMKLKKVGIVNAQCELDCNGEEMEHVLTQFDDFFSPKKLLFYSLTTTSTLFLISSSTNFLVFLCEVPKYRNKTNFTEITCVRYICS